MIYFDYYVFGGVIPLNFALKVDTPTFLILVSPGPIIKPLKMIRIVDMSEKRKLDGIILTGVS